MRSIPNPTTTRTSLRRRLALPLLIGATVLLGACGSNDPAATDRPADDPTTEDPTTETTPDVVAPDGADPGSGAAGSEPASACGLFDVSTVDAMLGTSGTTTSRDTSLGLYDGCRWATAPTDVPALVVGYDPTGDADTIRDLACDGDTAVDVAGAGTGSVVCFGTVIVPAPTGVIMVRIDDPLDQWDDDTELGLAAAFAAAATVST
ncbi:MAG: hypothetical protein NTZ21_08305 [Actinobacteria bacterium]|nr:hypothetical protein [Actinomycetota bacterium]